MGNIESVGAGALGPGRSRRITATVNTALTVPVPSGGWGYVKVTNRTEGVLLTIGINEPPAAAPASTPPVVGDWKAGYDIDGKGSEIISLEGATTIYLLSSALADVVLNLVA